MKLSNFGGDIAQHPVTLLEITSKEKTVKKDAKADIKLF